MSPRTTFTTILGCLLLLTVGFIAPALAADTIATAQGDLTVHPINHGTLALTWSDHTVYVDPVGGAGAFAGLPTPTLVLVTDVHGDHLDAETIAAVIGDNTTIVAPRAVAEKLGDLRERTEILANGDSMEVAGLPVEAIPMYNLTEGREDFHTKGRGNGYVVTFGDTKVYVSGDTEDVPEMRALEGIDAAFVCMNLPYTMEVDAAADAVLEFAPRIVYPYHYRGKGMVSDVERFRELVAAGNPEIDVRLLDWYE